MVFDAEAVEEAGHFVVYMFVLAKLYEDNVLTLKSIVFCHSVILYLIFAI